MAIGKPRGAKGSRPVYVYDPLLGRKVYAGSRVGIKAARLLEREKASELGERPSDTAVLSCRQYADRWLELKHGPGTKRPAASTLSLNRSMLKPFLRDFGDRKLKGIARREALDWSMRYPRNATVVSALFNDAVDDELLEANPFRNRRQTQSRGRRDIHPLTEAEVQRLGEIAVDVWKGYGPVCRAWITFSAWVGTRPGETFTRTWEDLDFEQGLVRVTRVKGRKQTEWIVFPDAAKKAVLEMGTVREGLVFRSVYGRKLTKGSAGYYWRNVRDVFMAEATANRRLELVPPGGDLDLYMTRHFCASILVDRGLDEYAVAHQLGNSPEVCRRIYIHVHVDRANERIRQALNGTVVDLESRRRTGTDR